MKIEHLAPYLPYGLKCEIITNPCKGQTGTLQSLSTNNGVVIYSPVDDARFNHHNYLERTLSDIKPYMRPLSDLTRDITHNGETFVPIVELAKLAGFEKVKEAVGGQLALYKKLYEWHFDIEKLIESGEAIDINTLQK